MSSLCCRLGDAKVEEQFNLSCNSCEMECILLNKLYVGSEGVISWSSENNNGLRDNPTGTKVTKAFHQQ